LLDDPVQRAVRHPLVPRPAGASTSLSSQRAVLIHQFDDGHGIVQTSRTALPVSCRVRAMARLNSAVAKPVKNRDTKERRETRGRLAHPSGIRVPRDVQAQAARPIRPDGSVGPDPAKLEARHDAQVRARPAAAKMVRPSALSTPVPGDTYSQPCHSRT
jgi:hypothetical protein